jgi:hypothetical protein
MQKLRDLLKARSYAGMHAAAGEKPREPRGAAPRTSWKRCDLAGQGGCENQLSCRNQGIHECEEFR